MWVYVQTSVGRLLDIAIQFLQERVYSIGTCTYSEPSSKGLVAQNADIRSKCTYPMDESGHFQRHEKGYQYCLFRAGIRNLLADASRGPRKAMGFVFGAPLTGSDHVDPGLGHLGSAGVIATWTAA